MFDAKVELSAFFERSAYSIPLLALSTTNLLLVSIYATILLFITKLIFLVALVAGVILFSS